MAQRACGCITHVCPGLRAIHSAVCEERVPGADTGAGEWSGEEAPGCTLSVDSSVQRGERRRNSGCDGVGGGV